MPAHTGIFSHYYYLFLTIQDFNKYGFDRSWKSHAKMLNSLHMSCMLPMGLFHKEVSDQRGRAHTPCVLSPLCNWLTAAAAGCGYTNILVQEDHW